jgi:IS605 OrfB family transposase
MFVRKAFRFCLKVTKKQARILDHQFFKRGEKALAKMQRQLAKLKKGTPERRKKGKVVAKIHERVYNQRKDFCHKESRKIIDEYQYICVEDLNIKKMIERSSFAKSIAEASWNQFCRFLSYKAEEAGRRLGWVNPAYTQENSKVGFWLRRASTSLRPPASPNLFKLGCFGIASLSQICGVGFAKFPTFELTCVYTTQTCSQCGHLEPKNLAQRFHEVKDNNGTQFQHGE